MIFPIIITVLGICSTESDMRNVINHNDGGSPSYGVCQIKLRTARQFSPKITIKELMIPSTNILMAKTIYEWQVSRYKTERCAISAYNAGRCITGNHKYVKKVRKRRQHIKVALASSGEDLFFRLVGLQLSKSLKHQLQNAIRLERGDQSQDFRYTQSNGEN